MKISVVYTIFFYCVIKIFCEDTLYAKVLWKEIPIEQMQSQHLVKWKNQAENEVNLESFYDFEVGKDEIKFISTKNQTSTIQIKSIVFKNNEVGFVNRLNESSGLGLKCLRFTYEKLYSLNLVVVCPLDQVIISDNNSSLADELYKRIVENSKKHYEYASNAVVRKQSTGVSSFLKQDNSVLCDSKTHELDVSFISNSLSNFRFKNFEPEYILPTIVPNTDNKILYHSESIPYIQATFLNPSQELELRQESILAINNQNEQMNMNQPGNRMINLAANKEKQIKFTILPKYIECLLREGYFNLVRQDCLKSLILQNNPAYQAINTVKTKVVPVRLVVNLSNLRVLVTNYIEILSIPMISILAAQINEFNKKCFNLFLSGGNSLTFCEITNISCGQYQQSNSPLMASACVSDWVETIVKFKIECSNIGNSIMVGQGMSQSSMNKYNFNLGVQPKHISNKVHEAIIGPTPPQTSQKSQINLEDKLDNFLSKASNIINKLDATNQKLEIMSVSKIEQNQDPQALETINVIDESKLSVTSEKKLNSNVQQSDKISTDPDDSDRKYLLKTIEEENKKIKKLKKKLSQVVNKDKKPSQKEEASKQQSVSIQPVINPQTNSLPIQQAAQPKINPENKSINSNNLSINSNDKTVEPNSQNKSNEANKSQNTSNTTTAQAKQEPNTSVSNNNEQKGSQSQLQIQNQAIKQISENDAEKSKENPATNGSSPFKNKIPVPSLKPIIPDNPTILRE